VVAERYGPARLSCGGLAGALRPLVDRRQTGLGRKVDDARPVSIEEQRPEDIDAGRAQAPRCGERGVGILRRACIGGARHQAQQAGSGVHGFNGAGVMCARIAEIQHGTALRQQFGEQFQALGVQRRT